MNILVLISHYKNKQEIESFINEIENKKGTHTRVFFSISDNSNDFGELEKDNVSIFKPEENLGYMGGGDFAYKAWKKRRPSQKIDWIFFCNTDLTFNDDFFLCLKNIKIDNNLGGIAPNIRIKDTKIRQNPFLIKKMPSYRLLINKLKLKSVLLDWVIFGFFNLKKRFRRIRYNNLEDEGYPIYAGHGSIVILYKRYFEEGGTLTSSCFMYHEEIFIAEEMNKINLKIYFIPKLRIVHNEHSTTRLINKKKILKWKAESLEYIWKKYYKKSN